MMIGVFAGAPYTDSSQVKISGCDKPPCKLKRGTRAWVEQKFVAGHDTSTVTNSVFAMVLSVPLPFVGVDGTSACESIFNADGTPASCSLKQGTEYIYKREFAILPVYPTVRTSPCSRAFSLFRCRNVSVSDVFDTSTATPTISKSCIK
nr:uncharacterized protein LOC117228277 [Megalopta genalis]